ncbi:peptidase M4 family protein [Macrococcoides canis]|uniref:M4 family metallopeptidase n=1 Tax=Macrococcoides canis TaxID=1855823 RepID=UPI00207CD0C4|nr:M4 family metallopeptidase [Macrococcus canis]MCO4097067.1 peptidase M4 family protein [Macrococcus canis]UTH09677.1 peptidase M4 family protein [Macrococcus canis]
MNRKMLALSLSASLLATAVTTEHADAKQTYKQQEIKAKVQNKKDVKNVLKQVPGAKNLKKLYKHYEVTAVQTDSLGYTHYTLQPKAKGKFATDQEIKVHTDKAGNVVLVNGETDAKAVNPANNVTIDKNTAISNAFNAVGINQNAAKNLGGETVKSADVVIDSKTNKLVYEVEIITVTPKVSHWKVLVDADNGQVVEKLNLIQHAATTGTGRGVLGDTKTININSLSGGYTLEDITRRGVISSYSYNPSTGTANVISDRDRVFDGASQRAGVDANFYAGQVYNYYKNKFGRESYDNYGSPIYSVVHVNNLGGSDNTNNAAWIGDKMVYGDGDGRTFVALSGAKDIVAHEITHGVTQETANLEYYGQSGALNESFSDVFAFFLDPQDTLIGEDVYTPGVSGDALRSISNPGAFGQPSTMSQYVNTYADNGGVHINSGIPNKIAYDTIRQLGIQKSEQIYYRALTQYLTSTSDFWDAKYALAQSAYDLYGQNDANIVWSTWYYAGVQ